MHEFEPTNQRKAQQHNRQKIHDFIGIDHTEARLARVSLSRTTQP